MKTKFLIIILFLAATGAVFYLIMTKNISNQNANQSPALTNSKVNSLSTNKETENITAVLTEPIKNARSRVTKKPFGIKVSPDNSPVSPERFSGYHLGVDFETLLEEQNIEVPVYAVCSGQLELKRYASGYGGVVVQACKINGNDATVIYGHLKLSSINSQLNPEILAGEQIGVLGQAYSLETDGERKHLHLGIHQGQAITLLGYSQESEDLKQWIDILTLF